MSSRSEEGKKTLRGRVFPTNEVELVELRDGGLKDEITARLLELLDQIGGAAEEDAVAVLDQRQPDRGSQMRLADPRRAEQQDVAALSDPAVAGGDGVDMGLGQHGDGREVEGLECLSGQQARLREMSFDAAAVAFGQFMLHQGAEQTGGGPAFLVGLFSKARPERLDGWQAQFVQGQGEARGIDLGTRHAAAPSVIAALPTSWS